MWMVLGVVLGALLSTADTASDVAMLVLLYRDDEHVWFTLYTVFVGASVLLSTAHAAAYGGSSWLRALLSLFGMHHFLNAALSVRKGEKSDEYIGARLFQAVLESGPAAVLQLYIMLRLEEHQWYRILSMSLSGLNIASVLAVDTAPTDSSPRESMFAFVYCLCEVVSTMICMSLFAFLYQGWAFAAIGGHFLLIFASWRWWSADAKGRRCDLFGMGLFSAVLNIITTIHTGDDASYVYQFLPFDENGPHFVRGGAQIGAFLGLAVVQDVARVGYIIGAVAHGFPNKLHLWLAITMAIAFVLQHVALALYYLQWKTRFGATVKTRRVRGRSGGSTGSGGPETDWEMPSLPRKGSSSSRHSTAGDDTAIDIVNPVHRASFSHRGLAVAVGSW